MKKYFIILLILLSSLVSATKINLEDIIDYNYYLSNLEQVKSDLNEQIKNLPSSMKRFIGNEKINIYFITNEKERKEIKIQLKNKKIGILETGTFNNPNLEVYLTEEDINDIINAENPRKEAKRKLIKKEITYKTYGFITGIKIKILINLL